ncbi:MAG: lysophospholipid acyltransferase family protein [Candidatus Margulisiibacteriota bacterium]
MIAALKILRFLFSFVFKLPTSAALYLTHLAGELTFWIARFTPLRGTTAKNIKRVFPKLDGEQLADRLLRNVGLAIFELLSVPFFGTVHFERLCRIEGRANLDLALAKRQGVLFLLMHTGNYELTPPLLSSLGYRFNSVLKATDDPLFALLNQSRGYKGGKLINVLEVDMYRESMKALGRNEIVALLIDTGALEGRNEMITFLGRPVPVATGWLTLAERSGAAVLPAYSKREGDKIVLHIGEPLHIYRDNRDEVKRQVGQFYEAFIQAHPEQWAIFLNTHEVNRMLEGK